MKKTLLAAIALASFTPMFAQHAGHAGVGLNLGVAPNIEKGSKINNFELGGRVSYSFTDLLRGTLDLNYGFADKNVSTFTTVANVNAMIPLSDGFYLYPLAGVGFGNIHTSNLMYDFERDEQSNNASRFVFDIGIGGEYEFSKNFAAGLEFKYQYMKDFSRLPVTLSLTYKF